MMKFLTWIHISLIKVKKVSFCLNSYFFIQTYYIEAGKSIFDINPIQQSLSNCFKDYGYNFQAIHCGGDEPVHQEREQWSDGANAFALAPAKIISYSRNHETSHALQEAGYEKISAKDFITDSKKYIASDGKILITISSSELPRGRGGPRCLTMPLDRSWHLINPSCLP